MARVTPGEVKQIMDGCTLGDQSINAFIIAANLFITKVFEEDTDTDAALLKELERWFAAHLIASGGQRSAAEEEVDGARVKYTGKWGEKLKSTPYGQTVLVLDVYGRIEKAGKMSVTIYAVTSFD